MLWAIDVGNTQSVFGIYRDGEWVASWRIPTNPEETEDTLAGTLSQLCSISKIEFRADAVMIASVVPPFNECLKRFAKEWLGVNPLFLVSGEQVGIKVLYNPPHAVGADRIANCLAALSSYEPPFIIVDFGTATTFDVMSAQKEYLGGVIMPGVQVSARALLSHTAKLPQIDLAQPSSAIGTTTVGALQSGIVLGHAVAVDSLAELVKKELGGKARVIATGGLGGAFLEMCKQIEEYEPLLTLEGLRLAHEQLSRF